MKAEKTQTQFSLESAGQRAQQLYDILKLNETYVIPELRHHIESVQQITSHSFRADGRQVTLGSAERARLTAVKNTNDYIAIVARAVAQGITPADLAKSGRKMVSVMQREHAATGIFRKGVFSLLDKATLSDQDHHALLLILNETVFAKNELNLMEKALMLLLLELLKKGGPKKNEIVKMVIVARHSSLQHAKLDLDSYVPPESISDIKGNT